MVDKTSGGTTLSDQRIYTFFMNSNFHETSHNPTLDEARQRGLTEFQYYKGLRKYIPELYEQFVSEDKVPSEIKKNCHKKIVQVVTREIKKQKEEKRKRKKNILKEDKIN